jgi:hypothetical protein
LFPEFEEIQRDRSVKFFTDSVYDDSALFFISTGFVPVTLLKKREKAN